jgi:hypothetical protein
MDHLTRARTFAVARSLRTCDIDQIDTPGTYVENRWGTIFRMPKEALPSERHGRSKRLSRESWPVTRLTKNPDIPLDTARKLATHLGLRINF